MFAAAGRGASSGSSATAIRSTFSTATFANNFTVTKDMITAGPTTISGVSFITLSARVWQDSGSDAFDNWGYFEIATPDLSVRTAVPFGTVNGADETFYTDAFTHNGADWQVKHGWACSGIFIIEITQTSGVDQDFIVRLGGNYGSDSNSTYGVVNKDWAGNLTGTAYRLHTEWNNDGAMDSTPGDPQVTVTVVPFDPQLQLSPSSAPFTVTRSGDNEKIESVTLTRGATLYVQWGRATVDAVQTRIISDLTEIT
jgi:hypothetical protein